MTTCKLEHAMNPLLHLLFWDLGRGGEREGGIEKMEGKGRDKIIA